MSLFEDNLRKWQRERALYDAQLAANNAALEEQQRQAANEAAQSRNPGGLAGVLAGIGQSIGNVGKAIGATFGGAGTNNMFTVLGDSIFNGKSISQATADAKKRQDDLVKSIYGTDDTKDAYTKNLGSSLDAAATLTDFIPGLGAGAKVALNVGQGVVGGAGQQLADNGVNTTLEDIGKGALIGGASAGVGQAVGGALAKGAAKNPGKNIVGKALKSGIGRSAITGAASGSVGGGLATALNGGDLSQTLSGALQGASSGALGGAATGALYGAVGAGANKLRDKMWGTSQIETAPQTEQTMTPGKKRRQTPMDWEENDISGSAKKRNAFQKFGKALQDTGEVTENNNIYGRLNNNTARKVQKNGTIKTLKEKYGYTSADYDKAANLSTAANHFVRQEAELSGASGFDNDLVDRIALKPEDYPSLDQKMRDTYRKQSQKILQDALVDGGGIDEYSANGLYEASERAKRLAEINYEKSHNKMDGSVTNDKLDDLAKAYNKLKIETRTAADNLLGGEIDDITRENFVKMLNNAGAPKQAVKTLSEAKTLREIVRLTSPLEEARNMYDQMNQTQLKRGATTDSTKANIVNEAVRATGAPQMATALVTPVGQGVGKVEQWAGKGIEAIGNGMAGTGNNKIGKVLGGTANLVKSANSGLNTDSIVNNKTVGDLATSIIAREAGQSAANDVNIALDRANAQKALYDAQNAYQTQAANYQTLAQQAQQLDAQEAAQASPGVKVLDTISKAIDLALAAGDYSAYRTLSDLYQKAYKVYGADLEAATTAASANATSNLSNSQIENINKLETAGNAIDELEQLFQKAGGGQGFIGGNAANFMASLGLNSDVATYNSLAKGLVNQIGAAIGKTDSLNTEGEVNRALELIPKITDDSTTAANKLEQLRRLLQQNKQTTLKNYGVQ